MESRVGSILTLIGGILTLVFSIVLLVMGLFMFTILSDIPDLPDSEVEGLSTPFSINFIIFFAFFVTVVAGILKIMASRFMTKPEKTNAGGIWALILGVLTSDILSIIGGIFGIVDAGKTTVA